MRKIILLFLMVFSTVLQARWATFADAPCEFVSNSADIMVYKDGTTTEEYDYTIRVLNEVGRDGLASVSLFYTKDTTDFALVEASIANGEQKIELDHEYIEDKPMASELKGFDQKHQVLLSFPNIQVGSVLHIKYRKKLNKPRLPGFYEQHVQYLDQFYKQARVTIKSELPLFTNYNSLNNTLSVKHSKEKNLHVVNIVLDKPLYVSIADEKQSNINPDKFPWIDITSSNDTSIIYRRIAQPFNDVLQQPLPKLYEEIFDAVKDINDPEMQISTVMSMLNSQVQYMGDWKSNSGRFAPQPLARVAQRRLGDCKDFSAGTAAILNKLGMQADVALVYRSEGIYYKQKPVLPLMNLYNHAIVRAEHNGKVYWIDPTNFTSIAGIIMPDIGERPSLVCSKNAYLDFIPSSTPQQNSTISEKSVDLHSIDLVAAKGHFSLHGIAALDYIGAELQATKESIINNVLNDVGNYEYMQEQSVQLPDLRSRIAQDLTFHYQFKEKDFVSMSNAGKVVALNDTARVANKFIFSPDQVSDIYLGVPRKGVKVYKFTNIKPHDTMPLDAELKSPWIDISRQVTYKHDFVEVRFEYQIKRSWLSRKEIKSKEYQKMADKLSSQFGNGISLVFN